MNRTVIPDLGGGSPRACTRALARSAGPAVAVDSALTQLCATVPEPPVLLDRPLLGTTLGDHPARTSRPVEATPDPPPEVARPRHLVRRTPADCPPEPPAARAVREDPSCRVGTAQLQALASEPPLRAVAGPARTASATEAAGIARVAGTARSARSAGVAGSAGSAGAARSIRPPRLAGRGTALALDTGPWSGTAGLTERLGIDVRAALACLPRSGPAASAGLLDRSVRAGEPEAVRGRPGDDRRPVADAPPRVTGSQSASGRSGSDDLRHPGSAGTDRQQWPGTGGGLGESYGSRIASRDRSPAELAGTPAGSAREPAWSDEDRGPGRGGRLRSADSRVPEHGSRRSRAAARASGVQGPAGTEGTAEPGDHRRGGTGELARAGLGEGRDERADEQRHAGPFGTDERWVGAGAAGVDEVVEAAVERVLADAARRYGIGV